jgi:DNA-binding PadR family transcriptional regulator
LDGPEIQIGYLESQILEAIEKSPMDSVRLMEKIHAHRPGTVRNALTRLRRKGLVSVRVWKDGIRHYGLTDQGREEVKAKRSGCENGENCEMDSKTE